MKEIKKKIKWPNFSFSQLLPAALPMGSHRRPECHLEVRAAAKHRKCFSWRPDVTDRFELRGTASWEDSGSCRGDWRHLEHLDYRAGRLMKGGAEVERG